LTTEQTIADNAYFAQYATFANVTGGDNLTAPGTPWILYDGSLAGAFPLGGLVNYPINTWQELNWYPAYDAADFLHFATTSPT
jgi:hypothetical protein